MLRAFMAALFGVAAFSWPAFGQAPCGNHDEAVKLLAEQYGEHPIGRGLTSAGTMIEILASPDGSTWTILEVAPNGTACGRSEGQDWQEVAPEPAAPVGDPS